MSLRGFLEESEAAAQKAAALVDEEGMMAGARHFVSTGRAEGIDAAICCEPEDGEVCNVSKGALRS